MFLGALRYLGVSHTVVMDPGLAPALRGAGASIATPGRPALRGMSPCNSVKSTSGSSPQTTVALTNRGREALNSYTKALRVLLGDL